MTTTPEAIEAAARAICANHYPELAPASAWDVAEQEKRQDNYREDANAALSAAYPLMEAQAAAEALQKIEPALFKIEGIHHIHGAQCLCGFASHRSRSRTEHITGEVRAALRAALEVPE